MFSGASLTLRVDPACGATDCTDAINAALQRCPAAGCAVQLEPGRTYPVECRPGAGGAINISGMTNLVFGGASAENPATLIARYHPTVCPIVNVAHATNLTLQNYVMDMERVAYTFGTVASVADDNSSFVLALPDGAEAARDYSFAPAVLARSPWVLQANVLMPWDPQERAFATDLPYAWTAQDPHRGGSIAPLPLAPLPGGRAVRVGWAGSGQLRRHLGASYIATHAGNNVSATRVVQSAGVTLRDVRVLACGGMAHEFYANEGPLTLVRVAVARKGARPMSSNADAAYIGYTKGHVTMESCTFEGQGDDGANIFSKFYTVANVTDAHTVAYDEQVGGAGWFTGLLPTALGAATFFSARTLQPTLATIMQSASVSGWAAGSATFAALPPGVAAGDFFLPDALHASATVTNCSFGGSRSRGLIFNGRRLEARGNRFAYTRGAAITLQAGDTVSLSYAQGPFARDVTIAGNTFEASSLMGHHSAVVEVAASVAQFGPGGGWVPRTGGVFDGPAQVFANVTIAHNSFRLAGGASGAAPPYPLAARAVSGLVVTGNQLTFESAAARREADFCLSADPGADLGGNECTVSGQRVACTVGCNGKRLATGGARGSLLYIDLLSTSPFVFGLQALSLASRRTSLLKDLGPAESFFDQVSVAGGGKYYATVQHPSPPRDPWLPSSDCAPPCAAGSLCCADPSGKGGGYCVGVSACSDINSGHTEWEETLAVTLPTAGQPPSATVVSKRFNTSDCYKLALAAPDEVLCLAQVNVNATAGAIALFRLDAKVGTSVEVGRFPAGLGIYNEAAAHDATTGVFYAYLGDDGGGALHAMNASSGALLPTRRWPDEVLVLDFAIDEGGACYAALLNRTDNTWRQMLAELVELAGPATTPVAWRPVDPAATDTFGVLGGGKCTPGASAGAAKKCYGQLNNAFVGGGTFFITGFSSSGSPEAVIGVDVRTVTVTLEHEHSNSNMVDMVWTPWEAPAAAHEAPSTVLPVAPPPEPHFKSPATTMLEPRGGRGGRTRGFVTRRGSRLFVNGSEPFRFGGTNEYWLGRGEDGPLKRVPSKYDIEDGLLTCAGMGLTVVRSHSVGISTGHLDSFEPALGVFNESALDTADYAIAFAESLGLRMLVPLTNNGCHVAGCRMHFTRWLGLDDEAFYTDADAIGAFQTFVRRRLEHVNPYTGRRAVDEPAILGWESGNELTLLAGNKGGPPPAQWTRRLAAFVKSIDSNHLFMDGAYGVDPDVLGSADVDLHSNHYYPCDASRLRDDIKLCRAAGKPLVIGEYGWTSADKVDAFFAAAEAEAVVAGTAFWSTFPHADTHGFVQHGDGFTLHYPGDDAPMRSFAAKARRHAFRMRGVEVPPPFEAPPVAPIVTAVNATHVSWAGAAMAANYSVELSLDGGEWRVVCDHCATDNDTPVAVRGGVAASASVRVTGFGVTGLASPTSKVWPPGSAGH